MLDLHNHNDIKSEVGRSKQVHKDDLKKLFYRNETNFYFEMYVIKMKQTFNLLKNYTVPLYE